MRSGRAHATRRRCAIGHVTCASPRQLWSLRIHPAKYRHSEQNRAVPPTPRRKLLELIHALSRFELLVDEPSAIVKEIFQGTVAYPTAVEIVLRRALAQMPKDQPR